MSMKATTKKDNNNNNDSSCEDNYSEVNHNRVNENKDNYNCQPLIWPMTMYKLYTNHPQTLNVKLLAVTVV